MSENRQVPYGRGGAGNMAKPHDTHVTGSAELVTPTLKADIYTTGRGGSGNMVPNEDPESARVRQDVGVPVPVRDSVDTFLTGRGGVANAYRVTSREESGPEIDFDRGLNRTKSMETATTAKGEKNNASHTDEKGEGVVNKK